MYDLFNYKYPKKTLTQLTDSKIGKNGGVGQVRNNSASKKPRKIFSF